MKPCGGVNKFMFRSIMLRVMATQAYVYHIYIYQTSPFITRVIHRSDVSRVRILREYYRGTTMRK